LPIAYLECDDGEGNPSNVAEAYAADGTHVASIGWRPHMADTYPPDGLFLC
jgi:hypothetical protein